VIITIGVTSVIGIQTKRHLKIIGHSVAIGVGGQPNGYAERLRRTGVYPAISDAAVVVELDRHRCHATHVTRGSEGQRAVCSDGGLDSEEARAVIADNE